MNRIECSVALLLLVVPALVGCSANDDAGEPQATPSATADPEQSSPLATYPPPRVGMDAALQGTLRLVDGCVVVEGTDGSFTVPIFPSGEASWRDGVLAWDGEEYSDGDTLFAGGGGGPSQQQDAYFPSGCAGLPSFLVGA
jgi:hypothetical protein